MNRIRRLSVLSLIFLSLLTMSFMPDDSLMETKYIAHNIQMVIKGTSTLHDWEMKSDKGNCEVVLMLDENYTLTDVAGLRFSIESESLKSKHTLMDNKTYEALKSNKFKTINFVLSSAKVTQSDAANYQINGTGKLTIAGVAQVTDLIVNCRYNKADKSFTCTGTRKLKMTDYTIKPPSVMLGTIKAGDEISVSFTAKIIKK